METQLVQRTHMHLKLDQSKQFCLQKADTTDQTTQKPHCSVGGSMLSPSFHLVIKHAKSESQRKQKHYTEKAKQSSGINQFTESENLRKAFF
jgi:hypothetical protein